MAPGGDGPGIPPVPLERLVGPEDAHYPVGKRLVDPEDVQTDTLAAL